MKNKANKNRLSFNYNNLMAENIGKQHGIENKELEAMYSISQEAIENLKAKNKRGEIAFTELPYQKQTIKQIKSLSKEIKENFDNFVVLGIGGSALGNISLQTALNHPFYNSLSSKERNGQPKIFVIDNIDPVLLQGLLDIIDLKKTIFNVITKSGNTPETMANFLILRRILIKKLGKKNYAKHIIATTDEYKGTLREIATKEGYRTLPVPLGVGGRFSVLSPVGLLSAAVSGLNIERLLEGARVMDKLCWEKNPEKNLACLSALLLFIADVKKKKSIHVMMPYSHQLQDISDWFRQLWAESLGKEKNLTGRTVNVGPTPVKALGATDQHSQIQLYTEGPYDKVVIFLTIGNHQKKIKIPQDFKDLNTINYLGGHSLNELLKAEQLATEIALTKNSRPNCKINITELNEHTIGQLLYFLEMQTAYCGEFYSINAFNQPGVEAGKLYIQGIMGRKGFEDKAREVKSFLAKQRKKHII